MIRARGKEYCIDPAGDLIRILGKSWTLLLLGTLGNWPSARFTELQSAMRGIGARILAQRLRDLLSLGLVSRTVLAETPVRVEYRLTRAGTGVHRALVPLITSAARLQSRVLDSARGQRSNRTAVG